MYQNNIIAADNCNCAGSSRMVASARTSAALFNLILFLFAVMLIKKIVA